MMLLLNSGTLRMLARCEPNAIAHAESLGRAELIFVASFSGKELEQHSCLAWR